MVVVVVVVVCTLYLYTGTAVVVVGFGEAIPFVSFSDARGPHSAQSENDVRDSLVQCMTLSVRRLRFPCELPLHA